jgi:ABC-2 type transport system ATP-binding protein
MIEVRDLSKRYRELLAVENVSFTVQKGEIVGFLGNNGAGKSTTMKVITGYIPATTGGVKVAGFDVFDQPMEVKRRIGYLPEIVPVYPSLTVWEYLDFVAAIKGIKKKERKAEIDRVLEKAHLTDFRGKLIDTLSKGYKQRCGIAQALLGNPPVLILDEPTSGLDPIERKKTLEFIASLGGEHTIMLSTHILQEVEAICPRVIMIHRGKLIADDQVTNLINRYKTPEHTPTFVEVFVTMIEDADKAQAPAANVATIKAA